MAQSSCFDTHAHSVKSLNDKPRAARVVATLTQLCSVSDIGTVERELATLARGDARRERTDQGSERHDAFIAIQALRKGIVTASADVQTLWQDAIAKAQVWLSSFN
jgi:hypothetical protein